MKLILHIGLHKESLELIKNHIQLHELEFQEVSEQDFGATCKTLQKYQVLLIGEEVDNPIRFAQEAYVKDKTISILLVNDNATYEKVKQAMQFSPFIGPTVQCISNAAGEHMAPIVEDAMQRTAQRRSFARLKSTGPAINSFAPNALEKVRTDFTTKVLEEAPIGAVLISGTGVVLSINNYAMKVLGKSEKEVLGTLFHNLFPEPVQHSVQAFLMDGYLLEPKRVFQITWPESKQFIEFSVARINDTHSSNYKLLMINDVTSEVESKQRTQAYLEELEKLNANLARVNADLDTFVYAASHDLKAPILNIEGMVTLLEEDLGPARGNVSVQLEHIKRSVARFKRTIADLTEVSRIQRNFEEDASSVKLSEVFADVRELLEREIAVSDAVIEANFDKAPVVFFSRRNLNSILYNLVSNAIKYRHPERQPHVQIRAFRENGLFHLEVQDNGLGIPAAKRDRVFQLFKRMHSHIEGSGVGLYIVKRIVDNNGGSISVRSEEGKGSVFEVMLVEGEEV